MSECTADEQDPSTADLQATWTPDHHLFFWSRRGRVDEAMEASLPEAKQVVGKPIRRQLVIPGPPVRRRAIRGVQASIREVLPVLAAIPRGADVSNSIQVWSLAALLGMELATRQLVVPAAVNGEARWRVMLTRKADSDRFESLVRALPVAGRVIPTRARGTIRIASGEVAMRGFLDQVVDALYRRDAYPGSARGWALEFAEALRAPDPTFSPRDARFQGIPAMLSAWSNEAHASRLRLGFELGLPDEGQSDFSLSFWLHPRDAPGWRVPLDTAWAAKRSLRIGIVDFAHPAHYALRGLAHASRIFPAIRESLRGARPKALRWGPRETWAFLDEGVEALRNAGFEVRIPADFSDKGHRRLQTRMRVAGPGDNSPIGLQDLLNFRWELTLGDLVVDGDTFAEIAVHREPIVNFRGEWVILDPAELERLPDGLPKTGQLPAADALRAVLTGEYQGIRVVADDRLQQVLSALREPPDIPLPEGLQGELRPYQRRGFAWLAVLAALGLGACLADDMGLGKTIQLITHLLARDRSRPSLVVCPTSVLGNWARELARFAPELRVVRHHGLSRSLEDAAQADVVLTTYGLMVRDSEELSSQQWDILCLDEAQAIKNPDSQRAHAARRLPAQHRVAMSGTPIENRLDELWSMMEFLNPGILGPRAKFRREIAVPIERFGDAQVAQRLRLGVAPFLLRRLKTDPKVIGDLPEKIERRDYCPLSREQAHLYEAVVDKHMSRISAAQDIERRGHVLAMLTALKQVCNHPAQLISETNPILVGRSGKLERFSGLIRQVQQTGGRALIFTQYREMGWLLQRHLEGVLGEAIPFLHGGTPTAQREEMVRSFQEDRHAPTALLISLRAGGTGLNLTRANHVIHYDRWWNPAVEDQATDRAFRIGQRADVQVHKLICQGTLEERIDGMLEEKRALAESVVGNTERWVTELDDDALRHLVALGDDAVMEMS